jgi:hypothetical protein
VYCTIGVHVEDARSQMWLPSQRTAVTVPSPQLQAGVFSPSAQPANSAHRTPDELSLVAMSQNSVALHVVPPQSHSLPFTVIPVVSPQGGGVVHRVVVLSEVLQ